MNLDLGIDGCDVGVDRVHPAQHLPQQEPVVVIEVAGEGFFELGDLGTHPGPTAWLPPPG